MNLLLDTHIFLRWAIAPQKLARPVYTALHDPNNNLVLSVVSLWEMQIKMQIGKLTLPLPAKEVILTQRINNQIKTLPVLEQHVWAIDSLPFYHRDPFDRLLIAQAITEGYQLVSVDPVFRQYPVHLFA
jgi:PIN domain nuclease of toxin-antitoxin system